MGVRRILQVAGILWPSILLGQGVFTAADCNFASVDTLIEGPMHIAVNGDTIIIPAGNCTWSAANPVIVPNGAGITVKGVGNPNDAVSQMGASSSCTQTVITDNQGAMFQFTPNALVTSRFSCMELIPTMNWTFGGVNPVYFVGSATVCTSTQCPQVRIDNITLPSSWNGAGPADNTIFVVDNVFGVADHNSVGDGTVTTSYTDLLNVNFGHWQGVGLRGDNSWATPDTFGTAQQFYVENNVFQYAIGTDVDTAGDDYGGGRYTCRFNSFNPPEGTCQNHGTDTTPRQRGGRQMELYRNTWSCPNASDPGCANIVFTRSGASLIFDNTPTSGDTLMNILFNLTVQRRWRGNIPFGQCGGQPDASPWDVTDSTNLGPYTITAVDTVNGIVTVSGTPWTSGQFSNSFASPFSLVDTSQPVTSAVGDRTLAINTNTTNTLTLFDLGADWTPAVNDTIKVERATVCLDQSTRGQGALVENNAMGNPVLHSTQLPGPTNSALDPTYAANNGGSPANGLGGGDPGIVRNRDFYFENINQGVQTSTTSPFDGTTTIGMGHGTLALRPTTCTPSVGYWATDQGSWNHGGSGGQGQLFVCSATNTGGCTVAGANFWCLYYTPFTYPHPLVTTPAPTVITKNKKLNTLLVTE